MVFNKYSKFSVATNDASYAFLGSHFGSIIYSEYLILPVFFPKYDMALSFFLLGQLFSRGRRHSDHSESLKRTFGDKEIGTKLTKTLHVFTYSCGLVTVNQSCVILPPI